MTDGAARVSESAQILGFAGVLPQVAAAAVTTVDHGSHIGAMFAFGYASLLLSFVGGMWWGLAMRREVDQGPVALAAVVPSLVTAGLILSSIAGVIALSWALIVLGSAVMLTLLVDRWLVRIGRAPEGWMLLRVPLSLSLGSLTILAGILS